MASSSTARASFNQKKRRIVEQLSIEGYEYDDKSPKGSVDEGIRPLIDDIMAQDGLVTTSSCAGRVSIFMEGRRLGTHMLEQQNNDPAMHDEDAMPDTGLDGFKQPSMKPATPGGKGGGGKWLFISHNPLGGLIYSERAPNYYTTLFGLAENADQRLPEFSEATRFVHFKFEAMVGQAISMT
jgi:tRNA wybutosine-synthesizing protein 3